MKKFKFSLQQVLDLKKSERSQIEQELNRLKNQRSIIEEKVDKIGREWQAESQALARSEKDLLAAEYRMRLTYLDFLDHKILQENENLMKVMRQISEVQEKLLVMTRDEKVLKRLREKRYDEHIVEMRREEQNIADEIANQRTIQSVIGSAGFKRYIV